MHSAALVPMERRAAAYIGRHAMQAGYLRGLVVSVHYTMLHRKTLHINDENCSQIMPDSLTPSPLLDLPMFHLLR